MDIAKKKARGKICDSQFRIPDMDIAKKKRGKICDSQFLIPNMDFTETNKRYN